MLSVKRTWDIYNLFIKHKHSLIIAQGHDMWIIKNRLEVSTPLSTVPILISLPAFGYTGVFLIAGYFADVYQQHSICTLRRCIVFITGIGHITYFALPV